MKSITRVSWFYRSINVLLAFLLVFGLIPQIVNPVPAKAAPEVTVQQELSISPLSLREINASFFDPLPQPTTSTYILTMAINGSGTTSPPPGTSSWKAGTTLPILATASQGYVFASWAWTGSRIPVASPSSASTTLTMDASITVTANFQRQSPPQQLTLLPGEKTARALIQVNADQDAELRLPNDRVVVRIPQGAVPATTASTTIELTERTPPGSTGRRMVRMFEVHALLTGSTQKVTRFNKDIEISIQHEPGELAGLDLDSLRLYYLDEQTKQWLPVTGRYEPNKRKLTAAVNHFTNFGEQADPLVSGPGRVMAAQVNIHSGAATFNYPIELPPGPGGFKPRLELTYNSGSVDEMKNKRSVGSWVGIGWNLSFGRISYDAETNKYFVDFSGGSYELATYDEINYKTVPDVYFRITRATNTWELWDKEGGYYKFGGTNDSRQYYYDKDIAATTYYRWDLSLMKDTNGNQATASYVQDIRGTSPDTWVRSAYPEYIRYGNNEIRFITGWDENNATDGYLRSDNPISYGSNPAPKIMENRRLDFIEVKTSASLVRKYAFAYSTTARINSGDYGGIYYSGNFNLVSITQIGDDGASSLPAITFDYQNLQTFRHTVEGDYAGNPGNPVSFSWPHLTAVNSGYGATVSFSYVQTPDPNAIYYLYPNATGYYTQLNQYPTASAHWDKVREITADEDNTYVFSDVFLPIYSDSFAIQDTSLPDSYYSTVKIKFRFRNAGAAWSYAQPFLRLNGVESNGSWYDSGSGSYANYEAVISRPGPAGSIWSKEDINNLEAGIRAKVNSPGPGNESRITQLYVQIIPYAGKWTRQIVSGKTINSGIGATQSYSYAYSGDPVYMGTGWDQKYRGFIEVKETDAAGNSVRHYFYTTGKVDGKDAEKLSGKEYKTQWYDNNNNMLKEQVYDWSWINTSSVPDVLSAWSIFASSGYMFQDPKGIAVATDGYVYVTDKAQNNVKKFDEYGNLILTWGAPGTASGYFQQADGITISSSGYVYVADHDNARIQQFTSTGGLIRSWSASATWQYLYPDGAGDFTELTQYPASGANWDKVDEAAPDDDSTYIYNSYALTKKDSYNLQNTSLPEANGNALYIVQVKYRFRMTGQGNQWGSLQPFLKLGGNITLGTEQGRWNYQGWGDYSEVLARPGGGSWSQNDINNLQVGVSIPWTMSEYFVKLTQLHVKVSLYVKVPSGSSEDLRPDGAGDFTELSQYPTSGSNWDKVDEASADDDSTYVIRDWEPVKKDSYNLQNLTISASSYDVQARFRFRISFGSGETGTGSIQPFLRLNNNETIGTEQWRDNLGGWGDYAETLGRPGGGFWSQNDINNLQVGARAKYYGYDDLRLTQLYVRVSPVNIDYPSDIATDTQGNVYAADTYNHRIIKYDSTGTLLWTTGAYGASSGQFNTPSGIAVSSTGYIYVADSSNNRIQKFDPNGMFIYATGSYGSGDSQFLNPEGIAVSSSGHVFVADYFNRKIKEFSSTGTFLHSWSTGRPGSNRYPWRVAVSSDRIFFTLQNLHVANYTYDWAIRLNQVEETMGTKTSRTRFVYDSYGNVITTYLDGDISTGADDSTVHRIFYPNTSTSSYILSRPARERAYATATATDNGNTNFLMKETLYYYDGSSSNAAPPVKGNLTHLEQKKDSSNSINSYFTYDSYGNKLTEQDPNGSITITAYDAVHHTYPISKTYPVSGSIYALNFDGIDDYVQAADSTSLDITGAITIAAWAKDPLPPPQKVTDPAKQVKDLHTRKVLQAKGIDPDYVELTKDYGIRSQGKSPYSREYKDRQSGKLILETSGLPMVDAGGAPIEAGWSALPGEQASSGLQRDKYVEKNNLFKATVAWTNVELAVKNNQPDGRKANDKLTFRPQLFLNGVEKTATGPALLAIDPVNSSYQNNVLEWDYGVAKRRLRLIEGSLLGSWVFAANPGGDVRLKYNQAGSFKLRLGMFKINDDEELITRDVFDNPRKYNLRYPIEISDTATFYPDANTGNASVDGRLTRFVDAGEPWSSIRSGAGTGADPSGLYLYINIQKSSPTAFRWLERNIMVFDTSALPDTATISSATLSLYGWGKDSTPDYAPDMNIFAATPASNTDLVPADYGQTATTALSNAISFANWSATGYNDFPLNDLTTINRTGVSKFSARNANYDAANIEPPGQGGSNTALYAYASEKGAGYKPKLVVIYTAPMKTIVSKGRDAYSLEMSSDGSTLSGYINNTQILASVATPLAWHHYALTYDGASQKLYIDGAQVSSSALTGAISANATNLMIGDKFSGPIDEVRIYSTALSAAEIANLYNNIEVATAGLQARYRMNEGSGATIADDSGNNNNGTISGATWILRGSTALSFDGSNDWVSIADSDALDFATSNFTVSLWFQRISNQGGNGEAPIINKVTPAPGQVGYELRTGDGYNAGQLALYNTSGVYLARRTTTVATPGVWYHLAYVVDRANNNIDAYVNGVLDNGAGGFAGGFSSSTNIASAQDLWLGRSSLALNNMYGHEMMDEVRFYSRTLSAAEIASLSQNVEISTSGLVARYRMDEGEGGTIEDDSGNSNTGTISGAVWQAGNRPLSLSESYNWATGTYSMLSKTDVNGQVTSYEYDAFKRLTKVIKPGDSSSSPSMIYTYASWGYINQQHIKSETKIASGNYLWQSEYFDGLGRVVQAQAKGETGRTIIARTTAYNNRGLAEKQYVSQDLGSSQVNGYYTPTSSWKYSSTAYDGLTRVATQTWADGTIVTHDYSDAWQDTVTNERGKKKRYYNDAFARLVKVEEMDDNFAGYSTTTYSYDVLGNLLQVKDNSNNTTSVTYSWLSRKTSMIDPDMGTWSYSYDSNGNLISQTDAKAQTISFSYDALNRLTAKTYSTGMATVTYTYDSTMNNNFGKGRRTGMVDGSGIVTWRYDNWGQVIEERRMVDGIPYTTTFAYDAASRLTSVTYPTGETATQGYNGRGLPYSLGSSVNGFIVSGVQYNSLALPTQIDLGNSTRTTYGYWDTGGSYDNPGGYFGKLWQIKTVKDPSGSPATLQWMKHTWDAGGNLTQRDTFSTATGTWSSESFSYDFLDRLKTAGGAYATESYNYATIGNMTSKNDISYTYGSSRPHAVTSVGFTGYIYDANGNMTTRGAASLTWDAENRLTGVTGSASYVYDGNGFRVKKTEGGQTILYINQYYEKNLTTSTVTLYYYLGDKRVAYKEGSSMAHIHQDHLSGTSINSDTSGTALGTITYFPWGATRSFSNPLPTQKFTGQRLDDVGLYYYGARYYDPGLGRFISADSIIPALSNPQALNRYSYALNNPSRYLDPDGHMPVSWLNGIYNGYARNSLNRLEASIAILVANGGNVRTAVHEIAQVNAARELSRRGFSNIVLEYKIPLADRADIVSNGEFVWEVKPKGDSPEEQLTRYTSKGNLTRGENTGMNPINNIPVIRNVTMDITFGEPGEIYYSLFSNGENGVRVRVTATEVEKQFREEVFWASVRVIGAVGLAALLNRLSKGAAAPTGSLILRDAVAAAGAILFSPSTIESSDAGSTEWY